MKSLNLSVAILQHSCCWYITLRCDLDLWPSTLNIGSVSRVTWWNSVPNLNAIKQSTPELLWFGVWPYDLEHCIMCCAWLWDNFHKVWPSTTYTCLNYNVFMLIRYVMLWHWPLTHWPASSWYIKHHMIKVCTKFERNRAIPGWIIDNLANFCTHYVTLWP